MKSVLISVKPKWCELIVDGKKTVEVRKTKPAIETPFKCYIYCTQEELLTKSHHTGRIYIASHIRHRQMLEKNGNITYSGKVIGEFVCDKIYAILGDTQIIAKINGICLKDDIIIDSCLTFEQLTECSEYKTVYFWHISDLVIYDKPKELNKFYFPSEKYCEKQLCGGCPYDQVPNEYGEYEFDCEWKRPLKRPPQSWCYVEKLKK